VVEGGRRGVCVCVCVCLKEGERKEKGRNSAHIHCMLQDRACEIHVIGVSLIICACHESTIFNWCITNYEIDEIQNCI